jgi:hypothetical protein
MEIQKRSPTPFWTIKIRTKIPYTFVPSILFTCLRALPKTVRAGERAHRSHGKFSIITPFSRAQMIILVENYSVRKVRFIVPNLDAYTRSPQTTTGIISDYPLIAL